MAGSQNNHWGQHDLNRYANTGVTQEETRVSCYYTVCDNTNTTLTLILQYQEYNYWKIHMTYLARVTIDLETDNTLNLPPLSQKTTGNCLPLPLSSNYQQHRTKA